MAEPLDTTIEQLQLGEVPLQLTPEQFFDYFDAYGIVPSAEIFQAIGAPGFVATSDLGPFSPAPLSGPDIMARFQANPALLSYLDTVFVDASGNLVNSDGTMVDSLVAAEIERALGGPVAVPAGQAPATDLDRQIDEALANVPVDQLTAEERVALQQAVIAARAAEAQQPGSGKGVLAEWSKKLGLDTGLGRIIATIALGAAGLGAAQLFAGDTPRITLPGPAPLPAGVQAAQQALNRGLTTAPSLQPQAILDANGNTIAYQAADGTITPATAGGGPPLSASAPGRTGQDYLQGTFQRGLAGQETLSRLLAGSAARELQTDVEQAPQERTVRLSALEGLPEMLVTPEAIAAGEPVTPMDDVIRDYLRETIGRISRGEFASPALERRLGREEEAVRNRLRTGLGRDYELSTAGMQGVNEFGDYANTLREEENRRYLSSFLPQEESRSRFAVTFPEDVRRSGVNERLTLSNFGRRTAPQLTTSLSSMVPVQPLLGLGDAAAAARQQEAIQTQAALTSFGIENENRRALSQGIGGLAGTAAAIGLAPRTLRLSDGLTATLS